jgi:hypothetical protein
VLTLDSTQPLESSRFQLAYQVCAIALADGIAGIVAEAPLRSEAARHLLAVGLGNYAAGALTMPYTAFAQARAPCATMWTGCASRSTPVSSRCATASPRCNARRRAAFRCSFAAWTWPAT